MTIFALAPYTKICNFKHVEIILRLTNIDIGFSEKFLHEKHHSETKLIIYSVFYYLYEFKK